MALRFSHITLNNAPPTDPNLWTVHRGPDGYVSIHDENGLIVDEPTNAAMALLSDFEVICYAIGWHHCGLQEQEAA